VPNPHSQSQYQVRFDWGMPGAMTVADDADAIVWVDQLGFVETELPEHGVVLGSIQCRTALADWALERQGTAGDRFVIAVIAAGEARADGSLRFAVEDLLGAGAVIDALAEVGIDHCSPEAAAAAAAYAGLRNASSHLIAASASGKALGLPATRIVETDEIVVLREFATAS
jgi:2-phosphosulfolactate phosphatase